MSDPALVAKDFQKFAEQLPGITYQELLSGLRYAAKIAAARYKERGISGRTWSQGRGKGWKGHGVTAVVNKNLSGGLVVKGIPALLERGGKTRAHTIRSQDGGPLVIPGRGRFRSKAKGGGRQTGFAMSVQHPGSRVSGRPVLAGAMGKAVESMRQRLDARLQAAGDQIGSGAVPSVPKP